MLRTVIYPLLCLTRPVIAPSTVAPVAPIVTHATARVTNAPTMATLAAATSTTVAPPRRCVVIHRGSACWARRENTFETTSRATHLPHRHVLSRLLACRVVPVRATGTVAPHLLFCHYGRGSSSLVFVTPPVPGITAAATACHTRRCAVRRVSPPAAPTPPIPPIARRPPGPAALHMNYRRLSYFHGQVPRRVTR